MELSKSEVAKLRRLLSEIDKEATVKGRPNVIGTRTRNARLILTKAIIPFYYWVKSQPEKKDALR